MAWRDLRLPGQGPEYREHPSDVGSPSYFADTGRGWVPNRASTLNRSQRNIDYGDPGITGRPSWRDFDNISQDYDRAGPTRGDISPFVSNQANIERANRRGIATLRDEDEKMGMLGHLGKFFGGMDLPMPKVMKMAGDTFNDAMRGVRLHDTYKDAAVAAGGTKAEGSRDWKIAKASMMTPKDQAFYDTYMNLASMEDDATRRAELEATAETAWRNKQTSDRLSAAIGFEGYRPSKYTGQGEGSRYTGSHPLAGRRVPGYDIMQGLSGGAWGASLQDAAEAGMVEPGITGRPDWDTFDEPMFDDDEFVLSPDTLFDQYPDEPGMMKTEEDWTDEEDFILGDTLYPQYPDTPTGYMMKPESRNIPFSMLPQVDYFGVNEEDREGTWISPWKRKIKHRNLNKP